VGCHPVLDMPVERKRIRTLILDLLIREWGKRRYLQTLKDVRAIVEAGTCGVQIEWSVGSGLGCGPSMFRRKVHVEHMVCHRLSEFKSMNT
jgi:hypothetical protein